MTKPFDLDEFLARLRAIQRRRHGRADGTLRHGRIVLSPHSHAVSCAGIPVALARREFQLLQLLLESSGRVLRREYLEQQLYQWGSEIESNALEVHIHHLRKKLYPELIRTVRGIGYVIDPP
jgi:DNA-binding response OmpR family regulator